FARGTESRRSRPGGGTLRLASRAAVPLEEVVDPRAGALERSIGRRHVGPELADPVLRPGTLVHLDPDAGAVHHLASPHVGTATGAIAHLLGAGLGAHVFHVAEH